MARKVQMKTNASWLRSIVNLQRKNLTETSVGIDICLMSQITLNNSRKCSLDT